jgi:hypothetical protein
MFCWMAMLSLTWHLALADESIREHKPYEPADTSPFDGRENILRGAKVSVSDHWSDRVGEFAVDGRHDAAGDHWGSEKTPCHLTVQLPRTRELNAVRLWTFWNNERSYRYLIEGSTDGTTWKTLADRRNNKSPATAAGETFFFPAIQVQQVRTTFTGNSDGKATGGHLVEIEGFSVPTADLAESAKREAVWQSVPPGLHGAVGTKDVRYARDIPPQSGGPTKWSAVAWRGERVAGQIMLWTATGAEQVRLAATPLRADAGKEIPTSAIKLRFVRYVLSDDGKPGARDVVADVLDTAERLDLAPRTARPVWISLDVPADASPGRYQGRVQVAAKGVRALEFPIEAEVLPLVLPPPSQWKFRLDLWQDPWSVARYHGVQPWSEAHWAVLEPHLRMLAEAGQKFVTTYAIPEAWGESTFVNNGTMIEWVRRRDGTFAFDYAIFDRYVEFAAKCGIHDAITCYSMIPWGHRVRYRDEATGDNVWAYWKPGAPEYVAFWKQFLPDFSRHLRQRGWFEKTYIGINESPWQEGKAAIDVIKAVAPGFKVTWAGTYHEQLKRDIDDWCFIITPPVDRAIISERARQGRTTTFYVCCGPARPNTFTFSPPAEAAWLGWYTAAQGYSGFLRWAYDSWMEDPLYDTRYVRWPAGDCLLVYPGPRSSIRFERLREGIADFEKIRIVRDVLGRRGDAQATRALAGLDAVLTRFTYAEAQKNPAADAVNAAQKVLLELSREATRTQP